jgi:hypothetical protein
MNVFSLSASNTSKILMIQITIAHELRVRNVKSPLGFLIFTMSVSYLPNSFSYSTNSFLHIISIFLNQIEQKNCFPFDSLFMSNPSTNTTNFILKNIQNMTTFHHYHPDANHHISLLDDCNLSCFLILPLLCMVDSYLISQQT